MVRGTSRWIFFFIALLAGGCFLLRREVDPPSFVKEAYFGRLRTDGFYYHEDNTIPDGYVYIMFLYRNGMLMGPGSFRRSDLQSSGFLENYLKSERFQSTYKELPSNWGLFRSSGDSIYLERWAPTAAGYNASISSGLILADTSFIITYSRLREEVEGKQMRNMYHFKPFSPKPDSINNVIE